MSSDEKPGRFVWYVLMTTDGEAAIDFYAKVAGWGTRPIEGREKPYTLWTVDGSPIGGVMTIDEDTMAGMPPNLTAYVSTPDIDATVAQVRELGGQVLNDPMGIPDVGRFAVAADPQGAVFSIFEGAGEMPEREDAPRESDFSWHELSTSDFRAAFDFYRELFGWEKRRDFDMGDGWISLIYGQDGSDYGGIYDKKEDMPGPPAWLYYIHVGGVDEAVGTVEENGGDVLNGPMDVPGGDRVAVCRDPQGAVFALHAT